MRAVSAPPLGNVAQPVNALTVTSANAQILTVNFTPFILIIPRILSSPLFTRARGPLPAPKYQRANYRNNPR
jgi:hypothetical protein